MTSRRSLRSWQKDRSTHQEGESRTPYDVSDDDDDYNGITAIRSGLETLLADANAISPDDSVWIIVYHGGESFIHREKGSRLSDSIKMDDGGLYILNKYVYHHRIRHRNKKDITRLTNFIPWHEITDISLGSSHTTTSDHDE